MRKFLIALFCLLPTLASAQRVGNIPWSMGNAANGPALQDALGNLSGQKYMATGGTTSRTGADNFADTLNVANYGAKCDGVTNDDAAINRTIAAAAASSSYQNNNAIEITGPRGVTQTACVMNSANMTLFTKGSGANPRPRVELSHMTWLCTGKGNTCIDATGSAIITTHDFSVRGDSVTPPRICIQVSVAAAASSAWHVFDRTNCANEFTLTALYNFGSEDNTYQDSFFTNIHTSNGPIFTFGTIVPGSGYTNGTYTNVALTGGSGTGALANITVAGGLVTSVSKAFEGFEYVTGDVLTAAVPGGSGFSVPITATKTYAVIVDGSNHWRASSKFTSIMQPVDTYSSLTLTKFIGTNIRGSQGGVWISGTGGLYTYNTYVVAGGASCVDLYDSGSGISHWGHHFELNCEGPPMPLTQQYEFLFTGTNPTPTYTDFYYRGYHQATVATFGFDTGITSVTLNGLSFNLDYISPIVPMFSKAAIVSGSGSIAVQNVANWNSPNAWQGRILAGGIETSASGIMPADIFPNPTAAWSCTRLVVRGYNGPLCQAQRVSDAQTFDLYPDSSGALDTRAARLFCNGTTCGIRIIYDESTNAGHLSQATAASQPTLSFASSNLNNRPSVVWATSASMALTPQPSVNDIFATGGYMTAAVFQNSNALPNRLFSKMDGSGAANPGNGLDFRVNTSGANPITVDYGAATSNGVWTTSAAIANAGHIYDMFYSAALASNIPVIRVDGVAQALGSTQPVGAMSSDALQTFVLGNNAGIAGANRGWIGNLGEILFWKSGPSAVVKEALARNEASYYGVPSVQ